MVILVAAADDDLREDVLRVAVELGRALGHELRVVHLVDEEFSEGETRRFRDELRRRLGDETIVSTVSVEYIGHAVARSNDRVGRELVDRSTDVDVSHVVMGHSSKAVLGSLTRGDAAFSVADDAEVPVTVVPEGVETAAD